MRDTLGRGGIFVIATHLGEGELYSEEFLGHAIARVGGTLYTRSELETALVAQQFALELVRERGPLPHEHQSQRIYLLATRS